VKVVVIGGFLGAGKTTMMARVARLLEADGKRVAVVLNDQGDRLVDTEFSRAQGLAAGEVTGGCFCCRFDDLASVAIDLISDREAEVVLAEAVGSCADLNATVIRPLREYHGGRFEVAPLTVMVDPYWLKDLVGDVRDERGSVLPVSEGLVPYLFRKQLEEADVIALNKVDLLSEAEVAGLRRSLQSTFPYAQVVATSAETGQGTSTLLELWSTPTRITRDADLETGRTLEIDYRRYADAEAELAWLNTTLEVRTSERAGSFRPAEWVSLFLSGLSAECENRRYAIGHAKVQLSTHGGCWTKASLVRAGDDPVLGPEQQTEAVQGELLVNARVEADPKSLQGMVRRLISSTNEALKIDSKTVHAQCFRPAPPKPTHRPAGTGGSTQ
jgi:G3E family GTPase